ncbi:MAG: nucleotidyltransferase family protein [Octadecabacter sp.]|nr:nucleotidyltransferase family protein [Octadecabacter sp.]
MNDHPTAALLFAAGLGTRMAPLTNDRPKPLIRVAGKTLLDHAIAQFNGQSIVVNAHYFHDQIEDHLRGTSVLISDERNTLLETGGGLKHALPLLGRGPVFTMNTDAVWAGPSPVNATAAQWDPDKMEALLLLVPTHAAVGHKGGGDFDLLPDGRIVRGTGYVYSGLQIIKTDGLAGIEDKAFSLWALWSGMFDRSAVFGVVYSGKWCDVGQPESIKIAEDMLKGSPDV